MLRLADVLRGGSCLPLGRAPPAMYGDPGPRHNSTHGIDLYDGVVSSIAQRPVCRSPAACKRAAV